MIYDEINTSKCEEYQTTYGVSAMVAKVLASKNLAEHRIQEILYSEMQTADFDLSFLDPIIERIRLAKQQGEKIMICGDYDCDGVCATTILYDALQRFGCECGYYIPDRFLEGYGVSLPTIKAAIDKGYQIVITVDNGVKATSVLQYAKDHGVCVILSDHHAYEETDLAYDYFFHPAVLPPFYGRLCGAGLAYCISKRLLGNDPYHTILACIATIGDMVGVLDANRVIIKEGIALLNTMDFPAIRLLADNENVWDATKIAFQIVPKINALGRLADQANVNTFVRYLLMRKEASLKKVSVQIQRLNNKRKKISAENEKHALALVDESQSFVIVSSPDFHEGLNGVVAAKLVNKYQRPAMVLSQHDTRLKGSIRSVGIDVSTFFDDFKEHLLAFGGHRQAAGIALEQANLNALIAYTQQKCATEFHEEHQPYIRLDKADVTLFEVESLQCLEPFGSDFEKPKFLIEDQELILSTLSNGLHLKLVSDTIEYLYFQHGSLLHQLANKPLALIGELGIHVFRNKKSITMIVDDVIE